MFQVCFHDCARVLHVRAFFMSHSSEVSSCFLSVTNVLRSNGSAVKPFL